MKAKIIASLLCAILPAAAMAQGYTVPGTEISRPRSTVDLSRTNRLTGTPSITPTYNCPSGQTLSGGSCVTLQNQTPYQRAWTAYFPNQTRSLDDSPFLQVQASISADGRVSLFNTYTGALIAQDNTSPGETNYSVRVNDLCGIEHVLTYQANPVFSFNERVNGSAPSDWAVIRSGAVPHCVGD